MSSLIGGTGISSSAGLSEVTPTRIIVVIETMRFNRRTSNKKRPTGI